VIELAIQCPKCGQWSAIKTSNLKGAMKVCPKCGRVFKIKGKYVWNANIAAPKHGQPIEDLVKNLNFNEGNKTRN